MRNLQEVFADPQLAARAMIAEIEHATIGPLRTLGVPVKLSDTPGAVRTPPPTLGQHTDTVLQRDLGIEPETISRLRGSTSDLTHLMEIADVRNRLNADD